MKSVLQLEGRDGWVYTLITINDKNDVVSISDEFAEAIKSKIMPKTPIDLGKIVRTDVTAEDIEKMKRQNKDGFKESSVSNLRTAPEQIRDIRMVMMCFEHSDKDKYKDKCISEIREILNNCP